jgi:hypothetical protein
MVIIKKGDVILTGVTSPRTHYPDCDWALAQEQNHHIRWQRHRRATDPDWFAERAQKKELRELLGEEPYPICTYCSCPV